MEGINLRDEAVKIASHVKETQSLKPEALNVAVQQLKNTDARTSFVNDILCRFPPLDDPHNTYSNLLRIAYNFDNQKPDVYADVCVLLIGHADLFRRFEQLFNVNDGEVDNWRFQVREKLVREIDVLVVRCRLTIQAIVNRPENLTADHQDCIETMFYSEIRDQKQREKMRMPGMESDVYRWYVLPALKRKLDVLQKVQEFVSDFFAQLFLLASAQP